MNTWIKLWLPIVLIVVMSGFFMRDLTKPGLPKMHDSNPHIARMIAYHQNFIDGQFPPSWAKEVLGGIGSPVLLLNYQLPYYFSEILVRLGFGYFDSYKIVLGLSFILSGLVMYYALSQKYSAWASLLGTSVYLLAPYRFVDIFVRGAYGEAWAFVFAPLILAGFWRRSLPLLIFGWAGLFLTHPLASAVFAGFFLFYTFINQSKRGKWQAWKLYWLSFAIAITMAAFNILPTLALTKHTYYTPADSGTLSQFPSFQQLINSNWGYGTALTGRSDQMSLMIGVGQLLVILASLVIALGKNQRTLRFVVVMTGIAIFFITPLSRGIYELLDLTKVIDFPWRLLICVVFGAGWLGAELTDQLTNKLMKHVLGVVLLILLIWTAIPIAHTGEYWNKPENWFARETGDSYGEYAPRTRTTRERAPFGLRAETIAGEAEIILVEHKVTRLELSVDAKTDSVIRINIAAFPGWETRIDGQPANCKITKRTLSHIDDSGLVACQISKGTHTVFHTYRPLPIQRVANLISLLGWGEYLWIVSVSFYRHITRGKRSSATRHISPTF